MQDLRHYPYIRNNMCLIGAALILSGCFMDAEIEGPSAGLETENELSGSVGDGPVVGAKMRVLRNDGELLAELESDFAASYNVSVKTKGKYYPLTIEARDGTDMVTFLAPDFLMYSAVLDPGKKSVANINPFTTIAMEIASEMSGGQSSSNVRDALDIVVVQLNSGLDTLVSTNPMSTRIGASNITEIVKASETLGETIRRTRDALLAVGRNATGDSVVQSLGSDLTDSVIDGIGGTRTSARIAAVSTIAAAQTAIESMRNQLHVNGSDATTVMSSAADNAVPGTPQLTLAELVTTENVIRQARIGVIAAEQISPSSEITGLRQAVSNLRPGMLPSAVDSILPQSASQLLDNVLLAVAAGDDSLLDTVNDTARSGGDVPGTNGAPTIQGSPATNVSVGASYSFMPVADDPDGDVLTFSISSKPAWAGFSSASGSLTGAPDAGDEGSYGNIVITVSDGQHTASLAPFSIAVVTVNSPPQISGNPADTVIVGTAYDFVPISSDPDGNSLVFSVAGPPPWASFDSTNGRLFGTPGAGDVGTHGSIVITVSDGEDSASLGPFEISVESIALGSITLMWVPPTEYDDGSPLTDLAGYRIYWGTTPGNHPNAVAIDNPGITTYVMDNLAPGSYEFVTTAINAAGVESDYSNAASKSIP